ncbi:MAG: acyl carrier protein [Bacteroidota bacterium]
MEISEFIKQIEAEFEDLKPGLLKPESNFREMFDWNSVNALIIIAMISTEYDVTITAEDLRNSKTVIDLYNIIKSRVIN